MTPEYVLQNFFGYAEFKPGQKEIIKSILEGKNVLVVLPTGGGKSICYQIPSLLSNSVSIVISPLIALMKDQVDSLNKKGKVAAFINSTLSSREIETVINDISKGIIKILYLAPEKLDNIQFAERIKSFNPSFLFVDEAHCISEWGHNFRPSYRKIKQFIEFTGIKKISAFTATATEDVRQDIIEQLGMKNPQVFIYGFERDNLNLNVIHTKGKKELLLKLINAQSIPAIIYTATRKLTEEVFDYLKTKRINSAYYHAGLHSELRRIIQDDFLNGRINVIVATNAFGMGINKSDIRTVIHYNLPANLENYYQEIGRAGRDGKEANIFLLFDEKDIKIQEYFINNSFPLREQVELVYNAICDYGKIALGNVSKNSVPIDNNLISFLESKGLNKALIDSSIRILDESGYLKLNLDFFKKHFVKFLIEPRNLNTFINEIKDNELKDFVLLLIRDYGNKLFQSKTVINLFRLSNLLSAELDSLIKYLQLLNNSGIISYERPSPFPSVILSKPRVKIEDLILDFSNTKKLIQYNKDKLDKMIGYIYTHTCRFAYILNYFGERRENYKCGKCDICSNRFFDLSKDDYLENHILQTLEEINKQIKIQELIEIIIGSNSKFQNYSTFGSCTHYNKNEIEHTISRLESENKISIKNGMILYNSSNLIKDFFIKNNSYYNNDYEEELKLFNLLRQIRKEASEKFNQPPQMICPDNTLREIAKKRPLTHSALIDIEGFNRRMFNKIGEEFLSAIKESVENQELSKKLKEKKLPQNSLQILELIQKKYSLIDIAAITKLPESVISIQIETLLEMIPSLEIESLFEKDELELINKKIDEGITELKALRSALNEKISYAKLRIAAAKRRVN